MKELDRREFGDPLLRQVCRELTSGEIVAEKTQQLIKDMRFTLVNKKLGIGLAAPQVGRAVALAVIAIRPTKHRPTVKPYDLVIMNPKIIKTHGGKKLMWEGCLSAGKSGLFAKVPRYGKVQISYLDENGKKRTKTLEGLRAQVVQHEIDHLNGKLFMDRVKDASSYMTLKEYRKQVTKLSK